MYPVRIISVCHDDKTTLIIIRFSHGGITVLSHTAPKERLCYRIEAMCVRNYAKNCRLLEETKRAPCVQRVVD